MPTGPAERPAWDRAAAGSHPAEGGSVQPRRVVMVGGGFSAACFAVQLLRAATVPVAISIIGVDLFSLSKVTVGDRALA